MDEYPDPDEEYEALHMEEMEVAMEMEREMLLSHQNSKPGKWRNALNFDNVQSSRTNGENNDCGGSSFENALESANGQMNNRSKKRNLSQDSLVEMTSDLEVIEKPSKKCRYSNNLNEDSASHSNNEYGTTSFRVPKWPFITISTSQGERLYVKLGDDQRDEELHAVFRTEKKKCGLLETPYRTLRALVEKSFQENLNNLEAENFSLDHQEEISGKANLWVEKFKPKTYFDLLSDEAVNRTLLNWLKTWDKIVFNKEPKGKTLNNGNNHNDNNFKMNTNKLMDSEGRPIYKVAMLCGPPGLGKTTLAHIAAVMAGYNVIEVNASDDRTIEALSSKLDHATQMQHVMGKRRPSCLILDEIDGAPSQTIEFLVKYISGKCSEKGKKGNKNKAVKVLKRPIICICNELYTPSLRLLRQQAFIIHFPNTSSTKLIQKLMEICKKQGIKTDVSALTLLCDKAQNDIRSCIHTLHFFKNKNGMRFKSTDVLKTVMGLKDIQTTVFNIWKEIFHNPIKSQGVFSRALNKATEDEVSSHVNYSKKGMDRLHNLVKICQSSGDYDRLKEGVYENFLKSKYSANTDLILSGLNWFCWFDMLDTTIKRKQIYSLMPYLPYSFGMWQSLYASNSFWKISYPTVGYENHMKKTKCEQILRDVSRGLSPTLKSFNGNENLLFDTLPLIDIILKPPLRPVNPTLFNESEKKDFKHLINVMMDFNLNYIQQRSADGTYSYHLDPSIDELIKFNVGNVKNPRTYSYNMKQIISHELELEKVRGSEENQESGKKTLDKNFSSAPSKPRSFDPPSLQPKNVQLKENVQFKDFFGRVVTREKNSSAEEEKVCNGFFVGFPTFEPGEEWWSELRRQMRREKKRWCIPRRRSRFNKWPKISTEKRKSRRGKEILMDTGSKTMPNSLWLKPQLSEKEARGQIENPV